MHALRIPLLAAVLFLGGLACRPSAPTGPGSPAIVFTNVNVVPMTEEVVLRDRTVLVRGDRIASISKEGRPAANPKNARVIDGRGGYLMPGLADMHVHINRDDLAIYVQHGITTVRNLWGFPNVHTMMQEIAAGDIIGPTIYSMSPGLDGTPASWPVTQFVNSPGEAPAVVDKQIADGWLALKLYQNLRLASFDAVIDYAKTKGMRYGGHVPSRTTVQHALESDYWFIEHFSGYDSAVNPNGSRGWPGWITVDESKFPELVRQTVAAGTWNCPTSAVFIRLSAGHPSAEAVIRNRRVFLKAMHDGGARLLTGTDSGIDLVFPGKSLLVELNEFVGSGLTPYQALLASTRHAAEFLGELDEFGTVEGGKRADLVLLRENPLESIAALTTIEGTLLRGQWLDSEFNFE